MNIGGDPVTAVHQNPKALQNMIDRTLQQAIESMDNVQVTKKQWEFHVMKVGRLSAACMARVI